MADVSSVTNHFPVASETYSNNLSAGIGAGVDTVPVNSGAPYANGDVVVLVVDPGTAKEAVFTGTRSGNSFINVVWTEGNTASSHDLGATVVDYVTATHLSMMSKGIKVEHNDDGTHKDITSTNATLENLTVTNLTVAGQNADGWSPVGATPTTITNNGNRSYNILFPGTDLTDTLSPGMRLRTQRTVAASTQCTDLEASSSQYASKSSPSGITFTDDFTCEAWVKLESYTGASQTIASRYNGTSGWLFYVNSSGQVLLQGINGGATNYRRIVSYQSLPIGKWVNVSAVLDMSGYSTSTSKVLIDGVEVSGFLEQSGTNPTALVQAGNLIVGAHTTNTSPFDGKISEVRVWSTIRTASQIRDNMSQALTGSETGLVAYFKLNGDFNDSTANANHLTASGGATATDADAPFGGQASGSVSSTLDYGIIQKATFSTDTTVTVQVAEGCTIPTSGGVASVSYSTQRSPYGFPGDSGKWRITVLPGGNLTNTPTNGAWYSPVSNRIEVPIGSWRVGYSVVARVAGGASVWVSQNTTLSTTTNSDTYTQFNIYSGHDSTASGNVVQSAPHITEKPLRTDSSLTLNLIHKVSVSGSPSSSNGIQALSVAGSSEIYAENAYL